MSRTGIERIIDLLVGEYGERDWRPDDGPVDVLVQTILSQNTSDTNSRRAFKSLQASFPSWEDVTAADVNQITDAIKGGGLGDVKARYIKQALGEIQRRRGRLELDFLNGLPLDQARDWLTQLPGVGTKTANCVFLFSLGRPALPVDTHVHRVAMRLGLIDAGTTVEKAHRLLESLVPAEKVYLFHVLMIEHGRRVCKAQRPRCPECVLREHCLYFRQNQPFLDKKKAM
jgi:endonuclease-3